MLPDSMFSFTPVVLAFQAFSKDIFHHVMLYSAQTTGRLSERHAQPKSIYKFLYQELTLNFCIRKIEIQLFKQKIANRLWLCVTFAESPHYLCREVLCRLQRDLCLNLMTSLLPLRLEMTITADELMSMEEH